MTTTSDLLKARFPVAKLRRPGRIPFYLGGPPRPMPKNPRYPGCRCKCRGRPDVEDIWDRYEIALFMLTRMRDGRWHHERCIEPGGPDAMTNMEAADALLKLGVIEKREPKRRGPPSYRWVKGQPIPSAERFEGAS